MLNREDIGTIGRGVAVAIRQAMQALEARLGILERQQIPAGIQSIAIQNHDTDRRSFVQTVTLADGRQIESEFKFIGMMLYREVYHAGSKYETGDVVTYDGAMWVALRDTTATPGKSGDWRLAVKRG